MKKYVLIMQQKHTMQLLKKTLYFLPGRLTCDLVLFYS
jgi:hypothetical protein